MRRKSSLFLALALAVVACSVAQERPPGTNRLIHESSPYLLQHARNPVDWYPWGDEAIELARALNRPIFLSIGYSTCYWCHRMEEDVFENPEIAALMNEAFVNIKVDREERPDLDEIYMTAAQLAEPKRRLAEQPLSDARSEAVLRRHLLPARGPRRDSRLSHHPRSRSGNVADESGENRGGRGKRGTRARLGHRLDADEAASVVPGTGAANAAFEAFAASFDSEWGGFGSAPKFPSPPRLSLLHALAAKGNQEALRMLLRTLKRMGEGALYDHLGGGFHRYTTDREWRVPHFEKMLYDNAALAEILVDTYRLTSDPELERLARGTLDFVLEKLTGDEGGFLSAIDAQSDGREGAYYVWTREEVESLLTPSELELVAPAFGLDRPPTSRRASILCTSRLPSMRPFASGSSRRSRSSGAHGRGGSFLSSTTKSSRTGTA